MKVVLTGGSSVGKTSAIRLLDNLGYNVIGESARDVLEDRKDKTVDTYEIKTRQRLIYELQLSNESRFNGVLFLDRGLIDIVAFSKYLTGIVPLYVNHKDLRERYDVVCALDRLPFVSDGTRIEESQKEAETLHSAVIQEWSNYGYSPISIPVLPLKERVNFILSKI